MPDRKKKIQGKKKRTVTSAGIFAFFLCVFTNLQEGGLDSLGIFLLLHQSDLLCLFLPLQIAKKKDYPTTNGGMQNGSSVGTRTHCIHVFELLAPILCALSVLTNKISASKFIKSAVLVG